MLEDQSITQDCNVLVLSFAQTPASGSGSGSLSWRWIGPDGSVDDVRTEVRFTAPNGCKDPAEWVKGVLGEVLLSLR